MLDVMENKCMTGGCIWTPGDEINDRWMCMMRK